MGDEKVFEVKVTQIKISKPFLKIRAQNLKNKYYAALDQLKAQFDNAPKEDVKSGDLCVARVAPERYERVRVMHLNGCKTVSVSFIDCGYVEDLPVGLVRILKDKKFQDMPSLCKDFILGEIIIDEPDGCDLKSKIEPLQKMLIAKQFSMAIIKQSDLGMFVDLRKSDASVISDLIPADPVLSKILKSIDIDSQIQMFSTKIKAMKLQIKESGFQPTSLISSPEADKGKSSLANPTQHQGRSTMANPTQEDQVARITAYENGPFLFYVRVSIDDMEYQKFQKNLQCIKNLLTPIDALPSAGTDCIVIIEDELRRAKVKQVNGRSKVKVQLLENGVIVEFSSFKHLFKMQNVIASQPAFAKPFKLAGLEKGTIGCLNHYEVVFFFRYITNNKFFKLKTISNYGDVPSCQLIDEENVNVLDMLRRCNPHNLHFTPQEKLNDFGYKVKVRSTVSPRDFHVTLMDPLHINELNGIEENLKLENWPLLRDPAVGDACIIRPSKYQNNFSFRGRITGRATMDIFEVKAVDYGFTDDYGLKEIRVITKDLLQIPPLSYKCCLKSYDNNIEMPEHAQRDFEDICKAGGKEFKMEIIKRSDDFYIVKLEDSNGIEIHERLKMDEPPFNKSDWSETPTFCTTLVESPTNREKSTNSYWNASVPKTTNNDHNESDWDASVTKITNNDHNESNWDASVPKITNNDHNESNWDLSVSKNLSLGSDWNSSKASNKPSQGSHNDNDFCWGDQGTSIKVSSKTVNSGSSVASSSGVSTMCDQQTNKKESVRISAAVNPTDFTIQKLSEDEELKSFRNEVQETAKDQTTLTEISDGTFCLAFHMFDKIWCRAVILDVDNKDFIATVKSLDDGTTFSIQDKSCLKTISLQLVLKPYFGTNCSLPIRNNPKRESESSDYLMGLMKVKLTAEFITKYDKIHYIELYKDGVNIADEITKKKLAKRIVIAPTGTAYITHVQDLKNFSIQMDTDSENLKRIGNYRENYNHIEVKKPQIGMLVLSRYKLDNCWYRARLQSVEKNAFEVYFVDFGHNEVVDQIGLIDDKEIAAIPPIAIKCSLLPPQDSQKIQEDVVKKFIELAAKGTKFFKVEMKKPGEDSAYVDLIDEGVNVLHKLLSTNVLAVADILAVDEKISTPDGFFNS